MRIAFEKTLASNNQMRITVIENKQIFKLNNPDILSEKACNNDHANRKLETSNRKEMNKSYI